MSDRDGEYAVDIALVNYALKQEGGQYPNTLGDLAGRNLISLDRPLELPGAVVNVFG